MRRARRWKASRRWCPAHGRLPAARRRAAISRRVPLIGLAQAGGEGYFDDGGYPVGGSWDEVSLPEIADPNAYALEISGQSMEPVFRDGDLVIVSPSAPIRRGDRVVVRTAGRRGHGQATGASLRPSCRVEKPEPGASRLQFRSDGCDLDPPHRLGQPVGAVQRRILPVERVERISFDEMTPPGVRLTAWRAAPMGRFALVCRSARCC